MTNKEAAVRIRAAASLLYGCQMAANQYKNISLHKIQEYKV